MPRRFGKNTSKTVQIIWKLQSNIVVPQSDEILVFFGYYKLQENHYECNPVLPLRRLHSDLCSQNLRKRLLGTKQWRTEKLRYNQCPCHIWYRSDSRSAVNFHQKSYEFGVRWWGTRLWFDWIWRYAGQKHSWYCAI